MMTDEKCNLDHIDLVLESVESYSVSAKSIRLLSLEGINSDIVFNGHLDQQERCQNFTLLMRLRDLEKIETLQEHEDGSAMNLVDRLRVYCDLVGLDLYYTNGDHRYILIPWVDSEYTDEANIAMQVRISSLGNDDKDAILGVTAVAK